MGRSDQSLVPFYRKHIKPSGSVALLGFENQNLFRGDLYDIRLNNWDINSDWKLAKKYDTIISLRCPYFSKDPERFIDKCYDSLNSGGSLYLDWGLGAHWKRFKNYKIGWVKNGEHESAYREGNFLWSCLWDDSFLADRQFLLFTERVRKFNYFDVKGAIFQEVPSILNLEYINKKFKVEYNLLALWEDQPQLYFLLSGKKRG
jgi:SAM-dependent methyltransferase|tara:strand:+ start:498 stop:1106 length:609 start_codon:yes stop_codon:yes gene_type:complete